MVEHTTENRGVGGSIPPLTTAPTLVMLCAPNLGMLDGWLPIVDAARSVFPDYRVVALIPDIKTRAQIHDDDVAHRIADAVCDLTIAPLPDGRWGAFRGFLAASVPIETAKGGGTEVPWPRPGRLRPLSHFARRWTARPADEVMIVDPRDLDRPTNRLLYDFRLEDGKDALAPLLTGFSRTPKISHYHGVAVERPVLEEERSTSDRHQPSLVLTFSDVDSERHRGRFGFEPQQVAAAGVLRHAPGWMSRVIRVSKDHHDLPFEEFVLVVSRPGGSAYLPGDRKATALRMLHAVAWEEHGLPLVIREHPKDRSDGIVVSVLPEELEGKSWAFSTAHPFHLAQRSRLGITFFSGISLDLIASDVPVIELLDVRDLEQLGLESAARDASGRILFSPYRQDAVVLPADDADDLRAHFRSILEQRDTVMDGLRERMGALFSPVTDSDLTRIAQRVIEVSAEPL